MQHMSVVDQLQLIDQQLSRCELSTGEQAAVDEFRIWTSQQRQQLVRELGPFPEDLGERAAWQSRKELRDDELETEIAHERLLRGLDQACEKELERDRLRSLRGGLLEAQALGTLLPGMAYENHTTLSQVLPDDTSLHAHLDQSEEALIHQQHYEQPDLLLHHHLHQQPLPDAQLEQVEATDAVPMLPRSNQPQQSADHLPDLQQPGQDEQLASTSSAPQAPSPYARHDQTPATAQEIAARKCCRICHEVKSLADYHRNKVNADGHNSMCKICAADYDKEKRRRRTRVHEPTLAEKECPHCKKVKAADGFYRYSLSQDGLYNICKTCHADQAKARQEAKAGMCPPPEKMCSMCRQTKPSSEFYANKTAADMLHSLCKTCHGDKCRSRASGNYDVNVIEKHCRACGQTKTAEDFPRNRMNKDGLHSYCKPCQNAKCAQYQRNSMAAKQEGRPSIGSPFEAPADQPFSTHKECKACHELRSLSEYYRSATNKDGLVSKCKRCMAQSNQRKVTEPTVMEKQCSECNETKPSSNFYKNRTNKDGLFGKCKGCSEGTKKERALNEVTVDAKVCKSCGEEKPASDFTRYRMRRDGLYNWCKACDIWKRQERRKRKRDEGSYELPHALVQGQVMHGDMDPGTMGLAEALDSQHLAQHLLKPYSDHAHLHSIVNAQEHLGHSVQSELLT